MYMLYSCRSSSSSDESSTKLALCNTKTTSSSVSVALVEPCESVVFCLSLASWPDLCFCFVAFVWIFLVFRTMSFRSSMRLCPLLP